MTGAQQLILDDERGVATVSDEEQIIFRNLSEALGKAEWDVHPDATIGCRLYDDNAYFHLKPIAGPYAATALIDGKSTSLEVRFCNPTPIEEEGRESLVFSLDENGSRIAAYTSDYMGMDPVKTLRTLNNETNYYDVSGVSYKQEEGSLSQAKCINKEAEEVLWST